MEDLSLPAGFAASAHWDEDWHGLVTSLNNLSGERRYSTPKKQPTAGY